MTTGLLTISQYVTNPPVQLSSDDVLEVRGWYTRNFIGGDGVTPIEGNFTNGQSGPYYSITPTLNGSGNLVVPAHEIQATTLSNPTGNYIEQLWVNEALVMVLMPNTQGATGWQIPTVYGDEISFDEIATYNRAKRLLYPPNTYFTADETIEEIRRLSGDRAYASATIVGITALSKDPDVPSFPEARGTNDPQWAQASVNDPSAAGDGFFDPDEGEFFGSSLANNPSQFLRANSAINAANVEGLVFNLATYGGVCDGVTPDDTALALALGAIGSTQAILVLPYTAEGQCLLALDATIPANVTIDFDASGTGFLLTNSRTLTIVGPIISEARQVFFNANASEGTVSFTANKVLSRMYPEWWGATADNSTDNFAALQAAATAQKTLGGGYGGGTMKFSVGTYLTSAAVQLTEVKSIRWEGSGRVGTIIKATSTVSAVQGNGIWYSEFQNIQFTTTSVLTNKAPFEIDGNYDSIHTQGVQANTFTDCLFAGNGSTYAFTMGRQSYPLAAQGDHNTFINCHFSGATEACYYQAGFNVLNTNFFGGDMQGFSKHGIKIIAGSINVYGTTFESTYGYTQIINGGFDIDASSAGVYDEMIISGVRTESLRFFNGSTAQKANISSLNYTPAAQYTWAANIAVTLNTVIFKTAVNGSIQFYRVTTAGTSGGTEPTWPNSGTVADGTATWTLTVLTVINLPLGSLRGYTGYVGLSKAGAVQNFPAWSVIFPTNADAQVDVLPPKEITAAAYLASSLDGVILADATAAGVTITLPTAMLVGKSFTIKKYDTTANTVTVTGGPNAIDLTGDAVIPGSSRGFVTLVGAGGSSLSGAYFIVAKSY